ncbi:translation Initiation Factor [Nesidiocoris tenuis]|uniref:Eukaryotic translation initiation factor 5B n=1 Tax=Nesidiocoris tenuis TaxID=355587 RepID=A0ABN7BF41_9HEMI|nr:translation Initiation Factor [Nesidiocoris tenuis]
MGKPKKGKRSETDEKVKDETWDSEGEDVVVKKKAPSKTVSGDDDEIKFAEDPGPKLKTKKEKKKKISESGDDDAVEKEPVKTGNKKAAYDSDQELPPVTASKGGFAALALSDNESEPEPSDGEEEIIEIVAAPSKKKDDRKAPGGKKGKKKKKDDDEEDLDKLLAELQMEYNGETPAATLEEEEAKPKEEEPKKKKKKEKSAPLPPEVEAQVEDGGTEEPKEDDGPTVKSAAQKKKEKKEREKQKRLTEKVKQKTEAPKESKAEKPEEPPVEEPMPSETIDQDDDDSDGDDKKRKKKKKAKGEKEEKAGKPNKKAIAAMQEALKKIKEEEEKLKQEEEEKIRQEEEAERQRQEQIRLEIERKEKKKQKEKEKKERLKAEGKLLNSKQKADRARAQALMEAMNAMRVSGEGGAALTPPKPKPFVKLKKNKPSGASAADAAPESPTVQVEIIDKIPSPPPLDDEPVKDSWEIESEEEQETKSEEEKPPAPKIEKPPPAVVAKKKPQTARQKSKSETTNTDSESESSGSGSESETESDSESEDEREMKKSDAQKRREKVVERIKKRQETNEKKRTLDELRAAVVCVLGHVDTGKTKILDKLRRTNVQDGEAGGITQQIGATNVPIDAIKENCKHVKGFSQLEIRIPGLLIIDTPGHESFSNLRSRGSSLCDIAILVVDIMHGLEPQTIESINLLKERKTPFIVALNKIDRLYDWQTMARKDVRDIIKGQAPNTQMEFEQRTNDVILQFAEQGLNAALFYNNPDVRSYVSLVPTSAVTGEGMGNLLALVVESCQTMLAKRLMFSEELQATVLEVKAIPGLGTTIDVILVNGYLREGDTAVLAGTEAPIVTQIRSLLMPQPLKELRVKNAYIEYKEIKAAQGVKITAKDLEKVIAGLNLRIAEKPDEVEVLKDEVAQELKHALSSIKLAERGVYVQASTLGSLEALLEFLRTSSIPYSNIRIGPVVKKDVMKASTMLEHESQYAVILAFDVKIERDAQDMADSLGVKIFQADIIYHLFDKFMAYREELKAKKREEFKSIAVFPCKIRILPQFVFNSRDPIVVGVIVEAGIVKEGTPICVPSKEFVDIGIVTSIENNHKPVESARKGMEVCLKIEPIPGESPKMFGRHFDEKDFLVSKISRQSIDACKDYFREDLLKTDWQLMVELKKLFQIL